MLLNSNFDNFVFSESAVRAHWVFDTIYHANEEDNSRIHNDISINSNNLNFAFDTGSALVNGNPVYNGGKSLKFDGIDDYADLQNADDLNPGSGNFTVSGWIKVAESSSNNQIICGKNLVSHTNFWSVSVNANVSGNGTSNKLNFKIGHVGQTFDSILSDNSVYGEGWVHFACIRSDSTMSMYINGNKQVSSSINTTNVSESKRFYVGKSGNDTAYYKNSIAELQFENKAKKEELVRDDYGVANHWIRVGTYDSDDEYKNTSFKQFLKVTAEGSPKFNGIRQSIATDVTKTYTFSVNIEHISGTFMTTNTANNNKTYFTGSITYNQQFDGTGNIEFVEVKSSGSCEGRIVSATVTEN